MPSPKGCPVWPPVPSLGGCPVAPVAGGLVRGRAGLAGCSAGLAVQTFQAISLGPQSLTDLQTLSRNLFFRRDSAHHFRSFMFAKGTSPRTDRHDSQYNEIEEESWHGHVAPGGS